LTFSDYWDLLTKKKHDMKFSISTKTEILCKMSIKVNKGLCLGYLLEWSQVGTKDNIMSTLFSSEN